MGWLSSIELASQNVKKWVHFVFVFAPIILMRIIVLLGL